MRKLILAVVAAALVPAPVAQANYFGGISPGDYSIGVSLAEGGICAATGMLIMKTGRMDVDYLITTFDGVTEVHTVPNNAVRLVIEFDTGAGEFCTVRIVQGGIVLTQVQRQNEFRMVFDVIAN